MLIPIGHEDQNVTRLPWVTIALVAANVAVFLVTLPLVNRQAAETQIRVREIVQFAVEHPYLHLPSEIAPVVHARVPPPDLPAETVADDQARLDRLMSDLKARAALSVFRRYGYIPAEPHLLSLFTSMFLHAGWLHLIGNMLFLWLAGGSLEDRWGRILFPILYVVSGIMATLIHAAMQPQSTLPLVGASGAIAGLMGAFLVRLATTRIRLAYWFYFIRGTFLAPAYVALPLWLLQQFMMARTGTAGGVAVWAHIGGFVFGVLVAIVIQATELEAKVLAPAIAKKTTWAASEQLAAALSKLDRGDRRGHPGSGDTAQGQAGRYRGPDVPHRRLRAQGGPRRRRAGIGEPRGRVSQGPGRGWRRGRVPGTPASPSRGAPGHARPAGPGSRL
jgi:membrane associated rhomboid family serine protease